MNPAKIARFRDSERYFICPICHETLHLDGASLRCPNRHTFDIAKQGYVNLAPAAKQSPFYNKASFENRARILEAGYYDDIRDAVLDAVGRYLNPRAAILDVGCGEGFYARAVQRANPAPMCSPSTSQRTRFSRRRARTRRWPSDGSSATSPTFRCATTQSTASSTSSPR